MDDQRYNVWVEYMRERSRLEATRPDMFARLDAGPAPVVEMPESERPRGSPMRWTWARNGLIDQAVWQNGRQAMRFEAGAFVRSINGLAMNTPQPGLNRSLIGRVFEVRPGESFVYVDWPMSIGSLCHAENELTYAHTAADMGGRVTGVVLGQGYRSRNAVLVGNLAGLFGTVVDIRLSPNSPDGFEYGINWGPTIAGGLPLYHYMNEFVAVIEAGRIGGITPEGRVTIAPPRPRPKVQIAHNQIMERWDVKVTNFDLSTINHKMMRPHVPTQFAKLIPKRVWNQERYYGGMAQFITDSIGKYSIPPNVMADALLETIIAQQAMREQGEFSAEARDIVDEDLAKLLAQQPPMIAIGDKLFTLKAHGVVSGARGMAIIRQKVLANAKQSAVKLLENARQEARQIVAQGEKQLAKVNEEVQRAKDEGKLILPTWVVVGMWPIRANTGRGDQFKWYVRMRISMKVDKFTLTDGGTIYTYFAKEMPATGDGWVSVWMPIDFTEGAFKYNGTRDGCRTEDGSPFLPHIKDSGCCMELQGMPQIVNSIVALREIEKIISRGMREVNLNSLLSDYSTWHPAIKAQTPQAVLDWLNGARPPRGSAFEDSRARWFHSRSDEKIEVKAEAEELFDLTTLGRSVAAAPPIASIAVEAAANTEDEPEIRWAPDDEAGEPEDEPIHPEDLEVAGERVAVEPQHRRRVR